MNITFGDKKLKQAAEDVRFLPGHYHELRGNRKGQWACDLDQPYRLVFKIDEQLITIKEIVNYHGK